jgi:hypothetical protein
VEERSIARPVQRALAKWREYISNLSLVSFYENHAQIVLSMKNMKDKIKKLEL